MSNKLLFVFLPFIISYFLVKHYLEQSDFEVFKKQSFKKTPPFMFLLQLMILVSSS